MRYTNVEFCFLLKAITGVRSSLAEAQFEIDRADTTGTGLLNLKDFLSFSSRLSAIDDISFRNTVGKLIERIFKDHLHEKEEQDATSGKVAT